MKDKFLVPAVITTLILLIIFMLICIIEQSNHVKYLQDMVYSFKGIVQEMQVKVNETTTSMATAKTDIGKLQNGMAELQKYEILTIKKELNDLKQRVGKSKRK